MIRPGLFFVSEEMENRPLMVLKKNMPEFYKLAAPRTGDQTAIGISAWADTGLLRPGI